jgi:eukaryotic-like serine/threonine-protein kinase
MITMDLIGRVINGRYKLIDERGSGSFGAVYIARDLLTNYIYAAKVMHLDQTEDGELLERFKREAYILQNLSDPHIVRLVDYGKDNEVYFIMMHHVDGQNLKWYVQNYGPMEVLRALNYTIQAAEGLDAAFKQGVVHRDIKPQNILVSNKGMVKIADFGLSRSMDTPTITTSDKFMGTAYYTAPEQVQHGHSADTRSDLYSLAVVFFESLAGHPPYTGGGVVDIVFKHLNDPVPSIRRVRPDVPPALDTFFERALAKSPPARYQTPREFVQALEDIQRTLRGPATRSIQARLFVITTGQSYNLSEGKLIIGREDPKREIHPDIQIIDQTQTLGRRHASLTYEEGKWLLEDLNSRNKTRLNGQVLEPYEPHTLKNGDMLHFGRVEARFELG